ncbi:hypothetical protein H8958_020921 [Nasalis larvatus]
MLTPPAIEATPEGTLRPAAGRLRFLNGCVPLSHQVAGHTYGKDKVGILQHPDGTVEKQLRPPPRGPRALEFCNTVYAADCIDATKIFAKILWYLVTSHCTKRFIPKTGRCDPYI